MKIRKHPYLIGLLILFTAIYALISLVNHYLFRTNALDLGLYTNALFKYGHFRMADSHMFKDVDELLLGDHFDLYLILFSPLVHLFGTYTLLIVQIAAVILGAAGVYRYFSDRQHFTPFVRLSATTGFLAFFGIFSAISSDYHSNVVAAMLIPWLFYFFREKNYFAATLIVILVLIAKENMSLWLLFICLGMMVEYRSDRKAVKYLLSYSILSLVYFIVVIYLVMPALSAYGEYQSFNYSSFGNTPGEALKNMILNPLEMLRTLFVNHSANPQANYVKAELHILVLVSGLYFLLLQPRYLIMLIPVYFQKMLHDEVQMWGINGQYAIEFAPILAIGIFSGISQFRKVNAERILALIALAGICLATFRTMDKTVTYTEKSRIRFYAAAHYSRNYDVSFVHQQLRQFPEQARISASASLVPHLALRHHIYQFPVIRDAEYIVYSQQNGKYPLSEEAFAFKIATLVSSGEWNELSRSEDIVILQKANVSD